MRKASICVLILLFFMWVVYPVYAYSGAVKVVEEAALALAKKEAVREAIAIAAAAGGGVATGSMALRIATAGVPWLGLGLTIGMIAYDVYYSSNDINSLYSAVSNVYDDPNWKVSVGGVVKTIGNTVVQQNGWFLVHIGSGSLRYYQTTIPTIVTSGTMCGYSVNYLYGPLGVYSDFTNQTKPLVDSWPVTEGWGICTGGSVPVKDQNGAVAFNATSNYLYHKTSFGSVSPYQDTGGATVANIEDWFTANPSSSLNPDNRVNPVGLGNSPQNATDVSYIPLSVGDVTVTTKAAPDVGDIVIGDGFPPVDPVVTESTQTTTRETTTVDGVDTIEETATTTCGAGSHDDRSFGSVLQSHVLTWQNNGMVASIGLLHSIAFPDTLPVINFDSMFGHLEVDMSDFSSWFTAVKVLLIASTVILSYRIVFGGG